MIKHTSNGLTNIPYFFSKFKIGIFGQDLFYRKLVWECYIVFGLGKPRSKFGKWVDKKGLTQNEIAKESNVGKTTISNMCSDPEYSPRIETWVKVKRALKKFGHNVDREDFFDM